MRIFNVTDKEFHKYGRVIDFDCTEIIDAAKEIPFPTEGSKYEASTAVFEKTSSRDFFENEIYGEMPIQVGYCYGHNNCLNALEWHKDSEVNVGVTDFVLILGTISEMKNGKYDSKNCKAFKVIKGQCVEIYGTTLHFCPCECNQNGFGCVVILPKGTNTELTEKHDDRYLFRKNKWIIAHVENKGLISRGGVPALFGKNIKI